jgi:hypothetical protein
MTAAWPRIVARLIDVLPTLPGWDGVEVYDGPPVTGDAPPVFVTVGFVLGENNAGSYEQTRNGEQGWQGALEESGTVLSEIVCATGDVDLPAVRARAFALADAWEAWVSADETLGVMGRSSISSLTVDVSPAQTTAGSEQRLTVTLVYLARS